MRRLLVVGIKEFRHIGRDLRLLFLVTIGPAFLLVTLAYVFTLDVGQVILAVRDADHTSLTRDLVSHIAADGDFVVASWLRQDEDADTSSLHQDGETLV